MEPSLTDAPAAIVHPKSTTSTIVVLLINANSTTVNAYAVNDNATNALIVEANLAIYQLTIAYVTAGQVTQY